MVVLVSPRLAVIDSNLQLSTTCQACSRAPFTSKETIAPPLFCWVFANSYCGCDGGTGVEHPGYLGMGFPTKVRQAQGVGGLRVDANLQCFQTLQQHPGVEGRQRRAGRAQVLEDFLGEFLGPQTAPPRTRP